MSTLRSQKLTWDRVVFEACKYGGNYLELKDNSRKKNRDKFKWI